MNFLEQSKQIIKENGGRLTKTKLAVLEQLEKHNRYLTPYSIAEEINQESTIDVVTVYRILSSFEKLGIVHKNAHGYTRCFNQGCQKSAHCHHHFTCYKCQKVTELHFDDQEFTKKINEKFKHLQISDHDFQFFGSCEDCL
jgi:Fe2+ or Zn2+ uptake regulation protein